MIALVALTRFRIVTHRYTASFRENSFYVKLTTFSTAQETTFHKKMNEYSESTSKKKLRSPWTLFVILVMSALICV